MTRKVLGAKRTKAFSVSKKLCSTAVQTAVADACGNAHAEDHVLTIKVVAKMFRISTWTLRFYEWRGLVCRESMGGEAIYGWRDCERIALIIKAKKAGLTLRQIAPVIEAMASKASSESVRAGHQRCRDLIASMTEYSDPVADVLAELERIDWEFSTRLAERIASR